MRNTTLAILLLAGGACALRAQTAASAPGGMPVLAEMKQYYSQIKNNLIRMAEKMPAADYDYKPVPEIRTFGALMAHIADAQTRACSGVNGGMKTPDAGTKKTKDEIVAALKASFDECDKAFDGLNDSNATQMVNMGGRGQASRLGLLTRFVVIHDNEEYGYGSLYLRMKGIVPPSSDTAGRGAPAK